jgi:hypothetical protein
LPPGDEHGPDNERDVRTIEQQCFNFPIEWQSPHRAWQKAKGLEHPSDVVGQSGRHTDELSPCAEKGAGAVAFERFDVNGPVPAGANDLSQSLRVVLVRLIDLHLEGGSRMPGVETNNVKAEIAEFMYEPRRHRSSFDPYASVISRISTHQNVDLFWN